MAWTGLDSEPPLLKRLGGSSRWLDSHPQVDSHSHVAAHRSPGGSQASLFLLLLNIAWCSFKTQLLSSAKDFEHAQSVISTKPATAGAPQRTTARRKRNPRNMSCVDMALVRCPSLRSLSFSSSWLHATFCLGEIISRKLQAQLQV